MRSIVGIIAIMGLLGACGGSGTSGSSDEATNSPVTPGNELSSVASISEMGVGDIYLPTLVDGSTAIDMSEATGSQYVLMVQSADENGSSGTVAFNLGSPTTPISDSIKALEEVEDDNLDAQFDDSLREMEQNLSEAMPVPNERYYPAYSATKAIGDRDSFKVLSSLTSTSSYTTVDARVKCETDGIMLYVDSDVDDSSYAGYLDSADIETLCDSFEASIAIDRALLGEPSDIDGNSKIIILLTAAVNQLGASGGGIITGFFYASDLYCSLGISNCSEIIYAVVPDPQGIYNVPLSKSFVMNNLLTAVVPHEVQHLISYNQHVFVNGGSTEQTWLNEAMSHLIEDLVGYGQENPSRYDLYLATTNTTSIIPSGSPNLTQRGASYLLLRYLYEQNIDPDQFITNLVQTSLTGVTNLETAFNGGSGFSTFQDFMMRWGIAVALTNRGVTTDSGYIYRDRVFNSSTGHWQGVCLDCDAEDGRGTILNGVTLMSLPSNSVVSLNSSAQGYYLIEVGSLSSTISLNGTESQSLQVVLMRIE